MTRTPSSKSSTHHRRLRDLSLEADGLIGTRADATRGDDGRQRAPSAWKLSGPVCRGFRNHETLNPPKGAGDGSRESEFPDQSPQRLLVRRLGLRRSGLILAKFGIKPIIDAIDARDKRISDQLAEAESVAAKAAEQQKELDEKLAGVEALINERMAEAKRDGEAAKAAMLEEGRTEIETMRNRVLREIEAAATRPSSICAAKWPTSRRKSLARSRARSSIGCAPGPGRLHRELRVQPRGAGLTWPATVAAIYAEPARRRPRARRAADGDRARELAVILHQDKSVLDARRAWTRSRQRQGTSTRPRAAGRQGPRRFPQAAHRSRRINEADVILAEVAELAKQAENRLDVHVATAVAMSDDNQRRLVDHLRGRFDKEVDLEATVDPELVGGMTMRIGNIQVDGSSRRHLTNMKQMILGVQVDRSLWDGDSSD